MLRVIPLCTMVLLLPTRDQPLVVGDPVFAMVVPRRLCNGTDLKRKCENYNDTFITFAPTYVKSATKK
jgi:hypothetical protein